MTLTPSILLVILLTSSLPHLASASLSCSDNDKIAAYRKISFSCKSVLNSIRLDRDNQCLPRFQSSEDKSKFDICLSETCVLIIEQPPYVNFDKALQDNRNLSAMSQLPFPCRSPDMTGVATHLSGHAIDLMHKTELSNQYCVLAGERCSLNGQVDIVTSLADYGYKFVIGNPIYPGPQHSCFVNVFHPAPFFDVIAVASLKSAMPTPFLRPILVKLLLLILFIFLLVAMFNMLRAIFYHNGTELVQCCNIFLYFQQVEADNELLHEETTENRDQLRRLFAMHKIWQLTAFAIALILLNTGFEVYKQPAEVQPLDLLQLEQKGAGRLGVPQNDFFQAVVRSQGTLTYYK